MTTSPSKLIVIPPVRETVQSQAEKKQLRVAAYCRVSTDDEEQLTSYEAQMSYYTDKITSNPDWVMADVFADEGKTGTSVKSRKDFQRMIRQCRRGKIDLILTKSLSRFARNTLDTVKYTRELRQLGIPVIFEKENLNSISWESEFLLTLYGAFAQSESESISKNVSWGKRQAMKEGKVTIQYKHLLGYIRGADGKPEIVPDQAEIIRFIFKRYLAGDTLRAIKAQLEAEQVPYITGEVAWNLSTLQSILQNEKYCGDVIMQKTFRKDCISKETVVNTGQLPKYWTQNHHEAMAFRHKKERTHRPRKVQLQARSNRASHLRGVRHAIPPRCLDAEGYETPRVAVCEPAGPRKNALQALPHSGREAAPRGRSGRCQHPHEPQG